MILKQRVGVLNGLFMGFCMASQVALAHTGTGNLSVERGTHGGPQPVTTQFLNLPIQFEANQGQVDQQVKFLARGKGYNLFLTPTESVMVLQQREPTEQGAAQTGHDLVAMSEPAPMKQAVVRMKLEGANPSSAIDGMEQLPGIVNYFIGNDPAKWRTKIPTYAKVQYKEAYPGIDLAYYGNQGKLEYDFIVAPGADPSQIKLAFDGVSDIKVAERGDLLLTTAVGNVRLQKPLVYQLEKDGHKTLVAGNYIAPSTSTEAVQIQLAAYDQARPLVIDPVVDYLTYLGGKLGDANPRIAVDSSGNAYIAGMTGSLDFPTTPGAYDPSFNANPSCPNITVTNTTCIDATGVNVNFDYFVSKISPTASTLLYATYIGGTGNDFGTAPIAVDLTGNVYIGGQTRSADFPVTPGAFQTSAHHSPTCLPSSNCSADGFLTKLDSTGSSLVYSTYFGGNSGDGVTGIYVDSSGFLYVTGDFASTDFPITPGAFSSSTVRGLLAKVNQAGTGLVWSTRLGIPGSGFHEGRAIALDSGGNVILVGGTTAAIMPIVGAVQNTYGGNSDAFVWKFNPTGTALIFSTFLGGSGVDWGYGVAVDAVDNIYLTGYTQSSNFPTTAGAYDQSHNGDSDIFVTKLSAIGSPIVYSTFLGGSGNDENRADIVVDAAGQAYVAGGSLSPNFPLVNAFDSTPAGSEIVLAKLTSDGSNLVYSSYLGGAFSEARPSIALGTGGSIYLAAFVNPTGLTTTAGVFQPNSNGGEEIFIAKITDKPLDNAGPLTANVVATPNPASVSQGILISATIDDGTTGGSNIASASYEIRNNTGAVVAGGVGDDFNCAVPTTGSLCPNPPVFDQVQETVTASIGTLPTAVYDLCVRGIDEAENVGSFACAFLVIYDPNGQFVTGGGWIQSEVGFCTLTAVCEGASGKAHFGFVSKYKKGATEPSGETQFEFKAGNLKFHSTEYEWLVVGGPQAQFKGSGTINNGGDYGFLLTARDSAINGGGQGDTFRIKIWDKVTGLTVYDNGTDQLIGGGSIVIH